jgi:hypothetical protein
MKYSELLLAVEFLENFGYRDNFRLWMMSKWPTFSDLMNYATYLAAAE